jgi:hypothetical protein
MPILVVKKSELLGCFAFANGGANRLRGRCASESSRSSERKLGEEKAKPKDHRRRNEVKTRSKTGRVQSNEEIRR